MSNSIAPGSSADVNVKVTALTTNPNVPVTYKTIILKKNLVNGVNTLMQEMMSATNTKYIIKYNYTLGEDITIPDNCILEFEGGSISGDNTLTGTNTGIKSELIKIFNTDVTLVGSWNINETYPEWFGAVGDGTIDDSVSLQKSANLAAGKVLKLLSKNYKFSNTIRIPVNTSLLGNSQKSSTLTYIGSGIGIEFGCFVDNITTDVCICDINLNINSSECTDGIVIKNIWRSKFSNIFIYDSTQNGSSAIGIHVTCDLNNGNYWDSFDNIHCWFKNAQGGEGIRFDRDETSIQSNNNAIRITNSDFHKGAIGINIIKGEAITIDGCAFEECGKGVYTDYRWTRIINNRFEKNNYDISFGNNGNKAFLKDNVFSSQNIWIENSYNKSIKPRTTTIYGFGGLSAEVSQAHYYDFTPIPGVTWNVYNDSPNNNDGKLDINTKVSIDIKVDNPGIVEFWLRTQNVYIIYIGAFYIPIANQYIHYEFNKNISQASGQINSSPNVFELLWRSADGVTVTCNKGYPIIESTCYTNNVGEL